jgi:hypothetical protein
MFIIFTLDTAPFHLIFALDISRFRGFPSVIGWREAGVEEGAESSDCLDGSEEEEDVLADVREDDLGRSASSVKSFGDTLTLLVVDVFPGILSCVSVQCPLNASVQLFCFLVPIL